MDVEMDLKERLKKRDALLKRVRSQQEKEDRYFEEAVRIVEEIAGSQEPPQSAAEKIHQAAEERP